MLERLLWLTTPCSFWTDSVDDVGFLLGGRVGRELMALFFWLCAFLPLASAYPDRH